MLNGIYIHVCLYYILSANRSRIDCSLRKVSVRQGSDCTADYTQEVSPASQEVQLPVEMEIVSRPVVIL